MRGVVIAAMALAVMGAATLSTPPPPPVWSYIILKPARAGFSSEQDYLNFMGAKGWELCGVSSDSFYFKRLR